MGGATNRNYPDETAKRPAVDARTVSDDPTSESGTSREAPIDDAVVERVADETGIDADAIADGLVVLNAGLIGRHAELERDRDRVTIDGTRAYRVSGETWAELLDGVDIEGELADAVALAHTEQAQLMFADATDVDDRFGAEEYGVVVGIDTAEEF